MRQYIMQLACDGEPFLACPSFPLRLRIAVRRLGPLLARHQDRLALANPFRDRDQHTQPGDHSECQPRLARMPDHPGQWPDEREIADRRERICPPARSDDRGADEGDHQRDENRTVAVAAQQVHRAGRDRHEQRGQRVGTAYQKRHRSDEQQQVAERVERVDSGLAQVGIASTGDLDYRDDERDHPVLNHWATFRFV